MKYLTRTYYTDCHKASMWERWREGWTLHQIAQLFNRAHSSAQKVPTRTGGIRPRVLEPLGRTPGGSARWRIDHQRYRGRALDSAHVQGGKRGFHSGGKFE